uniref:C2H2-type domain-containing protein n=1 Tax=Mesocestoides corti TaxID=53468 RepID=A0A5K3F525_MESCO
MEQEEESQEPQNDRNNSAIADAPPRRLTQFRFSQALIAPPQRPRRVNSVDYEDPSALFHVLVPALRKAQIFFSENELREKCLRLRIGVIERRDLMKVIRQIFEYPEDRPRMYSNISRSPCQKVTPHTAEEIMRARRQRKAALLSKSALVIEAMLVRNTQRQVFGTLGKLHMYMDRERIDESMDAFDLMQLQRVGRPHVFQHSRARFVCIFCNVECATIAALQAHLISQKHHFLNLPEIWSLAIDKIRQYEITIAINRGTLKSTESSPYVTTYPTQEPAVDDANDEVAWLSANNAESGSTEGEKVNNSLEPVIAHYTTCLFCGKKIDSAEIREGHSCTNQLDEFIEVEIDHFNTHGSPLVCLLCDCRVFDSPEALMVHAVGQHCVRPDPQTCPLCDSRLASTDTDCHRIDENIQQHVLDRHLCQIHLPHLEVIGRLFHSFGEVIAPKEMLTASTASMNSLIRSYRCCFEAGQPAGSGPPYPFEHWRPQRSRATTKNFTALSTSDKLKYQRPQRLRARRACLYDPRKIYTSLYASWLRRCATIRWSIFSHLGRPATLWCPYTAETMPQMIAHVVGVHGGNYLLQPGLRAALQRHLDKTKRREGGALGESVVDDFGRPSNFVSDEALAQQRRSVAPVFKNTLDVSVGCQLPGVNPIGFDKKRPKFRLSLAEDLEVAAVHQGVLDKVKRTFGKLDPLVPCCRINKQCASDETSEDITETFSSRVTVSKPSIFRGVVTKTSQDSLETVNLDDKQVRKTLYSVSSRKSQTKQEAQVQKDTSSVMDSRRSQQNDLVEKVFCRLCLEGPMSSDAALADHINEFHLSAYAERVERVKKRGSFVETVDSMRTCFQCYRVVESFIALQVHIACVHGSMYPMVCGLCHLPFTNQGLANRDRESQIIEAVKEASEKSDQHVRHYLEAQGYLAEIDVVQLLPPVSLDAKASSIFQTVHAGLAIAVHAEEIREVRSAIVAGHAATRMPASYLLECMRAHERRHVQQIRQEHFNMPKFKAIVDSRPNGLKERQNKNKLFVALCESSAEYRDLVRKRIDDECEVLDQLIDMELDVPLRDYRKTIRGKAERAKNLEDDEELQSAAATVRMFELFREIGERLARVQEATSE